ncbi:MANSC domain-containing protein 4-like [Periophthalmus magnuspinnatus]|uniref:MANSC domain-containing protein 4-like n=1 Tax=Periophthalmus magnuspinnatus TaxID=409849 RepID=UPI00145C02C9|nr:MANSC domain-containing protein 4-like [Periophthalmus magnuspinnatus]
MNATWRLLTLLSVVSCAEPRCSPTSYYKNCWIRRFPGIYIDVEESLRRGAQLLKFYQEDTALKCSRTCCLTRNFSCNLAIFHYDATQESVNCFHLHCPTLESCILSHRGNVVLYNITKGVDPDLLVFGKYFNTNVRVLPHHYIRSNASDPLPPDKRQFIHPRPRPVPPAPAPQPSSADASKTSLTTVDRREPLNMVTSTEHSNVASGIVPSNTETATTHPGIEPSNMAATTESTNTATRPETSKIKYSSLATVTHQEITVTTITIRASTFKTQASSSSDIHANRLSTTLHPPLLASEIPTEPPNHSTTTNTPAISSSDAPANIESSKHKTNDTKGNLGRNHTTVGTDGHVSAGGVGGDQWGEQGPGWHVATHTVLVAVAICVTVLLGCCCSVVLVFSWRGHRKRMGRYRTAWRGKKGSMRLIKYVLVKENS